MSLARKNELCDQYVVAQSSAPTRPWGKGLLQAPKASPASAVPSAGPVPAPPSATITIKGRPVKKLSQIEMEERRHLGLCYNCNDKFSRGHSKFSPRLFLLELGDADDGINGEVRWGTEEEPLISLHAIASVRTIGTMQVEVCGQHHPPRPAGLRIHT